AFGSALKERPDDEQVLLEIEMLAESTLQWGDAASYLVDALESEHNTDDSRLELWLRLTRILDEKLEQYDNAEHAYREILALDGSHEESLKALDRICLQQARWADLSEVLELRIQNTYDKFESVDLNYRLA